MPMTDGQYDDLMASIERATARNMAPPPPPPQPDQPVKIGGSGPCVLVGLLAIAAAVVIWSLVLAGCAPEPKPPHWEKVCAASHQEKRVTWWPGNNFAMGMPVGGGIHVRWDTICDRQEWACLQSSNYAGPIKGCSGAAR